MIGAVTKFDFVTAPFFVWDILAEKKIKKKPNGTILLDNLRNLYYNVSD